MHLYTLFLYCFLLLWQPKHALAEWGFLLPETDIKVFIEPRCGDAMAKGFNEARHAAKVIWEETGKPPQEWSEPLKAALKRWFNFESTDEQWVRKMRCKH